MNKKKCFFTIFNFTLALLGAIFIGFVLFHELSHTFFMGIPSGICMGNCEGYFSGVYYNSQPDCGTHYCGEILPLAVGIIASILLGIFVMIYFIKIFLPNFNID